MLLSFTRRLLIALLVLPLLVQAQAPADTTPVEGVDYVTIDGGAPFAPQQGRVEVAEIFGYTCPHCARFEPLFAEWAARQPRHVAIVRIAAPWGGHWQPYAQAFYAAQRLGVAGKAHQAVFDALHADGLLPMRNATPAEIADFYARYGVDRQRFAAAMTSAEVAADMRKAQAFILASGVEGTPALVVAGRYRILLRSPQQALRTVEYLVARERAAR